MQGQFVGINSALCPAHIQKKSGTLQPTVASVDFLLRPQPHSPYSAEAYAALILELLGRHLFKVQSSCFAPLLIEACAQLAADDAQISLSFPFFIRKQTPVSRISSLVEYQAGFVTSLATAAAPEMRVVVPVTTLCPCSREISRFGAHNQRAEITLRTQPKGELWLEDLIALVEDCGSAEMYTLLKREDEKHVTEQAYEHPMFVEDVARKVAQRACDQAGIAWFSVAVESFESIHKHSAYAFIDSRDLHREQVCSARSCGL